MCRRRSRSWASRMPPPPGTYRPQEVLGVQSDAGGARAPAPTGLYGESEPRHRASPRSSCPRGWTPGPRSADSKPSSSRVRAELSLRPLRQRSGLRRIGQCSDRGRRCAARGSKGCRTERCYGRRVIGWQDQLGRVRQGREDRHHRHRLRCAPPRVQRIEREGRHGGHRPTGPPTGTERACFRFSASDAESSTPGLVPDAEFLIADAFFQNSFGRARTDTARVLEALQRLEEHGAQVINMSLVGPSDDLVHDRIADMSTRKGVVFVAAAGNGGPAAPPGYPAAYKEVIAVTAVDDRKRSYDYANRGRYIDVAAPGVRIWTALPDRKEGMLNGTSFAAPFVTGDRRRNLQQHAVASSAGRGAPAARSQGGDAGGVRDREARQRRAQRPVWPGAGESSFELRTGNAADVGNPQEASGRGGGAALAKQHHAICRPSLTIIRKRQALEFQGLPCSLTFI